MNRRTSPRAKKLFTEPLEQRILLHSDGVLAGSDARFSLSFAPDGTEIASDSSTLFAQMDALAPRDEWQSAILRGFQTWAQHTNSDIGVVSDDGSKFGANGANRNDDRFGDIRIGSVPLDKELYATSISSLQVIDGTWAGDILFNSNVSYDSVDDLFAITLHEAGHVFGLEHGEDPESPMFHHGIPTSLTPTAEDIETLHSIYGERAPDFYESNPYAQYVPAYRLGAAPRGTAPSVVFADIATVDDTDRYRFHLGSNYQGSVTVELVASGISQLAPRLSVLTPGGELKIAEGASGEDVSVTITADERRNGRYSVDIGAVGEDALATGSYSLLVWYNDVNEVPAEAIHQMVREPIRYVHLKDLRGYFASDFLQGGSLFTNIDHGDNDISGTNLETVPGFVEGSRYNVQAQIESESDVDRYNVSTPSNATSAENWAQVSVRVTESIESNFAVNVYSRHDMSLVATDVVLSNGWIHVVQFEHEWQEDYVIEVTSDGTITDYEMSTVFGVAEIERETFTSTNLDDVDSISRHRLTLARPQLFHFNLNASGEMSEETRVEMRITTRGGREVANLTTYVGNTSTMSDFLRQGYYLVRVRAIAPPGTPGMVNFTLSGTTIDDPLGPRVSDSTHDPFKFDNRDHIFVPFIVGVFSIQRR